MHKSGILTIKPIVAELTHDTETFGKMDPYCQVTVGAETQKSSVAKDQGKKPSWQDVLTFKVGNNDDQVHIAIYDKETFGKDEFNCEGWVGLGDVRTKGDHEVWVPLTLKGKDAGKIMVCLDFKAV